jgi:hypothetical protein
MRWMMRWMLRRRWEVDERHILPGLLNGVEYPVVGVLTKRGVTLEAARQRLCATAGYAPVGSARWWPDSPK